MVKNNKEVRGKGNKGASAKVRREVATREPVWDQGALVAMKLTSDMRQGDNGVDGKQYAVKHFSAKGARFCVHLYADQLGTRYGQTIVGRLVFERKTFKDDGNDELYANVFEVTGAEPTHTLSTYSLAAQASNIADSAIAFKHAIGDGLVIVKPKGNTATTSV